MQTSTIKRKRYYVTSKSRKESSCDGQLLSKWQEGVNIYYFGSDIVISHCFVDLTELDHGKAF